MNRRAAAPAQLFDVVPQPRYVEPERRELYDSILKLRSLGFVVLRRGRGRHSVYRLTWGLKLVANLSDKGVIVSAILAQ